MSHANVELGSVLRRPRCYELATSYVAVRMLLAVAVAVAVEDGDGTR